MADKASFKTETFSHDKLSTGRLPIVATKRTLLSGDGARTRGAVLGRKATAATVAAAVADGAGASSANTGNGAVTLNATPFDGRVMEGNYRVKFIEPASDSGRFLVEDPKGVVIGSGVIGTEFAKHIVFTIADGGTDFIAGDGFLIAVSAVSYKYLRSASAAVDGSADPVGILVEDADSTSADAECLVYEAGEFNEGALNFGTGHTAATVREALRARGIHLVTSVAA